MNALVTRLAYALIAFASLVGFLLASLEVHPSIAGFFAGAMTVLGFVTGMY